MSTRETFTPKEHLLTHKYIQDIQIPSCPPTEAGNTRMAGLWKMLSQGPRIPQSSCCSQMLQPQQGKFLIQEDLIWPYTMAEALAQEDQHLWTGIGWEFLVEKLLSGKASVS